MDKPKRELWSEGELLEKVIEGMECEKAFHLGELMGVMRKGDAVYITHLEQELRDMMRDRNDWRDTYHKLKREVKEGGGKG